MKQIENLAFCECSSLKDIYLPASVKRWDIRPLRTVRPDNPCPAGSYAQRWAEKHGIPFEAEEEKENRPCLTTPEPEEDHVLVIPEGVLEVEEMAFAERTDLTGVVFPNSLRKIGRGAFYGCMGLTQVSLPQGVTQVGDSAFAACTGLTGVTLPESLRELGSGALCQLHQPHPHRPAGGTGAAGRLCFPGLCRPGGDHPAGRAAGDPGGDLFGLRVPPAVPPSGVPAGHRQAGL